MVQSSSCYSMVTIRLVFLRCLNKTCEKCISGSDTNKNKKLNKQSIVEMNFSSIVEIEATNSKHFFKVMVPFQVLFISMVIKTRYSENSNNTFF